MCINIYGQITLIKGKMISTYLNDKLSLLFPLASMLFLAVLRCVLRRTSFFGRVFSGVFPVFVFDGEKGEIMPREEKAS